jgi:protoporphyrinogen oxidase
MNRRGFIQISSVAILPILAGILPDFSKIKSNYSIKVESNRAFGHLLREKAHVQPSSIIEIDYVIAGGGIAGIAAAQALNGKDFMLFEANERLGGSSAAESWKSVRFAMGAHYELAYPETYGQEVIALLVSLDIIKFNPSNKLYEFVDEKYLIKPEDLEQCYESDKVSESILGNSKEVEELKNILDHFEGKMHLPTRLIDKKYHQLNDRTFKQFLISKINLTPDLERRINYQMLDDWGGTCDQISALAGIHYYKCRPYDSKNVQLFSPPFGNAYFIEKMIGSINNLDALHTNTMVRKITPTETGVDLEVINKEGIVTLVKAKGLIYAGQKHSLKYLLKTETPIFNNDYSPWVSINFVCKKGVKFSKWQNDVLSDDLNFLGFVNSSKQKTRSNTHDVFTAYYCFKPEERHLLIDIEKNPELIVKSTMNLIEKTTNTKFEDQLEHVSINLMAHAMPIPKPNYLSFDSVPSFEKNIIFAGVDTGRLPLFFEACDSGLQAAQQLLENTSHES